MKHLKKYNESNEDDIFTDESLLHDILLEYVDCQAKYTIKYKSFILMDGYYFIPVSAAGGESSLELKNFQNLKPSAYKGYQISFSSYENENRYVATDIQGPNKKVFCKPNNNLYKFFDITKDVQYRIESMGYIFLLSTHKNYEFDFMIIENK
jgi:hypothetical protein